MAPKPAAVEALSSQQSGRQVTLQGVAPDDPNRWAYRIEVGFAPGAVDLTFDVPVITSNCTVASVPPGTYYVRIRSLNAVTSSAATTEIQIGVP